MKSICSTLNSPFVLNRELVSKSWCRPTSARLDEASMVAPLESWGNAGVGWNILSVAGHRSLCSTETFLDLDLEGFDESGASFCFP